MKKLLFILLLLPLFAMPQAVKRHREIIIDSLSALTDGIIDVKDTLNLEAPLKAINIIFDSSVEDSVLIDKNSSAFIQFNAYGENDVAITSDSGAFSNGGALYIADGEASLYFDGSRYIAVRGVAPNTIVELDNPNGGATNYLTINENTIFYGNSAITYGIIIGNNTAVPVNTTSLGQDSKAIIIGGKTDTISAGVVNSVIVGGTGITATQNNTLYTQNFIAKGNVECDTVFSDAINIYSVSDTIDSAAISILNGTPVQIVAAPGSGKAIEVMSLSTQAIDRVGIIAWATNTQLILITETAGLEQATETKVLLSTATRITRGIIIPMDGVTTKTQIIKNEALKLTVSTGNPDTGNFDIKYYVTYRIITL